MKATMSRFRSGGAEPSQRMLRVAEIIRHVLCDFFARGAIRDPVLEGHVVTVSEVRMSPDLKVATVYVMPLGGKDKDAVLAALDRNKKFLRAEVATRINLRFAPEVRFEADRSFEEGSRIDALLNSPQVKRDLVPSAGKP
jgi:ribosome-binding factor A